VLVLGGAVVYGIIKSPGVVGSFATAAAAIGAVVFGQERQRRAALQQSHRERMAPIYEDLIERFKGATTDPEFFSELHLNLIMFSPAPVIRAWLVWARTEPADADKPVELLQSWERVLLAIRQDLGHDDASLRFGDLQRLYVHHQDADESFGSFER
jgi:hypothetical protein